MFTKLSPCLLWAALVFSAEARLEGSASSSTGTTRNNHEHETFESRIVGGSAAERGEYPYFVSWGGCAASLIAEDVILSAAHCAGIRSDDVIVSAHQRWWGQTSGDAESRTISERRIHPQYDAGTFENDFLVMKLTEPITNIKPVSINRDERIPANEGDTLTAIGFGAVFEGGWGPRLLQEVDVQYVSQDQCNLEYDGDIVENVMLCAGVPGGGKDSCQGDSGGPLVIKSANGDDIQVGVVSWGYGCGREEYSGVYSRISGAKEWIDKQVCELSENPPPGCGGVSVANSETTDESVPRAECSDSETDTFLIDDVNSMQGCSWLKGEMTDYGYLCKFVDVAVSCPDLCNICDLFEQ